MTSTPAPSPRRPVEEGLVDIDGHEYYAIPDVDRMPPFLMSVVSDGDRWMFVSSTGGLTAGRRDATGALFPYETDDRLHHAAGATGPVTAIRVPSVGPAVWTPFRGRPAHGVRRSLYKSVVGDAVIFEEEHAGLQLTFGYRWASCERFGFVRTARLVNRGARPLRVELIDGLLGVLPAGLDPSIYQSMSNLTNAYKRSEVLDPSGRLAAYSLEARISDRAEPAEMLRASIVWSAGLDCATLTLSPDAVDEFELGDAPTSVTALTGRPGAYLLHAGIDLDPEAGREWHVVADVNRDQLAVADLLGWLHAETEPASAIDIAVEWTNESLVRIMAPADALQCTGDRVATAHQFANVTYNVLRGGVPRSGYRVDTADFVDFVFDRNQRIAARHQKLLAALPPEIDLSILLARTEAAGDVHLQRLASEYLPFSFSRRHGDPSRPWNRFSIRVHDDEGRPIVYYEGNWRDIFQNWEALGMSFPEYLPSVVSVFLNASTPDGFNPYRITRHGIDWETPEPDNPWSNIGYWGDHQIVYLLRLLEAAERYRPGDVAAMLDSARFSYADVPYRLAPYLDLVRSPRTTIAYDQDAADVSHRRTEVVGGDGKLVWTADDQVYLVTLTEKLLVTALAKLSNFVPGGGIWMNTQRPEWNDANNALVGFGLSMVTLYHLRRYLDHLRRLVETAGLHQVEVSTEVVEWLDGVYRALRDSDHRIEAVTDRSRKQLMDDLGGVFSDYRARVYSGGFSDTTTLPFARIAALCDVALEHLDATIRGARRGDGLYHSYNLIRFSAEGTSASVEHLHEMLEGQVAVIDSGVLSAAERADVIDALFASAMYRPDQRSFMLYPARPLPSFLDKNVVPPEDVAGNPLLSRLVEAGDQSVIAVDAGGRHRFNPDFAGRDDLVAALDHLAGDPAWAELVAAHAAATHETYERVFRHHAYTGRSGSMYGYEGIGSIYWHMVAKLLVAAQHSVVDATSTGAAPATTKRLVDAYWRIQMGLGYNKTSREFGAIPIDPYSHTPAHAGAQQPGMTGLVKEELLTRPMEAGVRVEDGEIVFDPILLRHRELVREPLAWRIYDLELEPHHVEIGPGSLGVTICQVPVIVSGGSGEPEIEITYADGTRRRTVGARLDRDTSAMVFSRSGAVARIHAWVRIASPA